MRYSYSKENLNCKEQALQRWLEIIPGFTSWVIIIGLTTASIFFPYVAATIIVAFYLYWLLRLIYMTTFLAVSYFCLNKEKNTDWLQRINEANTKNPSLPTSNTIYHLVLFPVIKEGADITEPAVAAIKYQSFNRKQIIVVFALEERAQEHIKEDIANICKKYKNDFFDCFFVIHPSNIAGEARVKGANVTYAARYANDYLKAHHINPDHVIVSCFDADTVVDTQYFPCLTYHFITTPDRDRASFQPIPVYNNNIWHVPGFARVLEIGSSFFQLIEATNPDKLVTFSSHSMSFKALVDVDYWPVDMISDDSAIFWKCYIHYDGNYRTVPMYVTLSMDVAVGNDLWDTIKSVYKQKRRWAWGVENFPLIIRAFLMKNDIPLWDKIRHAFKMYEGHVSWASWGFVLSIIGWLPILFAHPDFESSVVYYNVPFIAGTIFNLAFVSLLISIFLSIALLPKTNQRFGWALKFGHALEWLLVPGILLFLSALPALDAQTRLMFGKYMEFWVTDKKRSLRVAEA